MARCPIEPPEISLQVIAVNETIPLISIIVPAYNEEKNLERTYDELKKVMASLPGYRFEIVFTDNHSTDGTFAVLKDIAARDPAVRVVRFSRNFGFHRSVLTGYRLAEGAAAIQIDADLQDPPALFVSMLDKWREGHDVVVGIRRSRKENFLLHGLRRAYYRLLIHLDGQHLIADAGDFRLIDRSIILKLRAVEDAHPYLRGLISSLAANQAGIPYDRAERQSGESKFPLSRLVHLALDGIIAHSTLPLRAALYVGLLIAFATMLLAGFYILSRLFFGAEWPPGLATTQVLILFGIGLNGIFLGVIGEYIGRIYDQVRLRPTTVIERALNFDRSVDEIDRAVNFPGTRL
jgi:dolichol-phosphate mannosyltransferase